MGKPTREGFIEPRKRFTLAKSKAEKRRLLAPAFKSPRGERSTRRSTKASRSTKRFPNF